MIKLIAHWQVWAGWQDDKTKLKRILAYFRYVMQAFNINNLDMVILDDGCPDAIDLYTEFNKYNTLIEALKANEGQHFVFLEAPEHIPDDISSIDLRFFIHPKDVVYVLGPEYGDYPWKELKKRGYLENSDIVYMNLPGKNKGSLMSHQALTAVLYDRLTKDINH